MTCTGYLIERYTNMGSAYTCRRLVEEASKLGMTLSIVGVADVGVAGDGKLMLSGHELEHRRFAINRYKWGHVVRAINAACERSYNSIEPFCRYVDKYEQVRDVRSAAFRIPKWVLGTAAMGFSSVAEEVGAPFVAKGLASSQGREIWLIQDEADMERLLGSVGPDKELLFEQCITQSLGKDIRVFGVRGEAVACMRRVSHEGFRANFALGAELSPYPVDEEVRQAVRDVYQTTGLDFFGLDLLGGPGDYWFCEVNVMAGMEGIERTTGVNVAGRVMQAIGEDVL